MKVILISKDADVINTIKEIDVIKNNNFALIDYQLNSCELLSEILSSNPALIIFDHDSFEQDTVKILKSIRKIDSNVAIIVVTSELGPDLGRELSQLAIHYRALKPVATDRIEQSIRSLKAFSRI